MRVALISLFSVVLLEVKIYNSILTGWNFSALRSTTSQHSVTLKMMFTKAIASSYLFVAILSFAEVYHASSTPTDGTSIRKATSCINFCFAIDGSTSISSREFNRQLFLATEITRNVPSSLNPGFAAVQYGIINSPISPFSTSRFSVIRAIRGTAQQQSRGTFITGAINYCFSELFDIESERPICPRSAIVVMGDGNENIGSDPAERSALFEQEGGDVIAVAFGSKVDEKTLMDIGGSSGFFDSRATSIRNIARAILKSFGIEDTSDTVES